MSKRIKVGMVVRAIDPAWAPETFRVPGASLLRVRSIFKGSFSGLMYATVYLYDTKNKDEYYPIRLAHLTSAIDVKYFKIEHEEKGFDSIMQKENGNGNRGARKRK